MKLSVVIVSWNTRALLEQCLESIYTNPLAESFDVWVVDNVSTDGSVEMVQRNFPEVRLIANHENMGFARGNNQAIQESRGEYVLLLNPDTEVLGNALQGMVQYLDEHPQVGAVGPRLLNPDRTLQFSCSPAPTLGREFLRLFHLPGVRADGAYPLDRWAIDRPHAVDVIQGAALMVRRSVLDRIGLLDDRYFIYTEETDLCLRIQRAGWTLMWLPQAQVVHYGGQSTRQVAAEMFLRLYESKVIYFRKHYGPLAALAYKAILFGAALMRLAAAPLALLGPARHRGRNRSISSNYRRLLTALPQM